MTTKPDLARTLAPLKGFQRDTVAHVTNRLWKDPDPTTRFLVADEVGLGKTLVGRGVIAETIEHLWDREDRIDIVYICSNSQIARQNLKKLKLDHVDDFKHSDRLTLLMENISALHDRKVNYISFTPGTSFTVGETAGKSAERVLLYHLLRRGWGRQEMTSKGWLKFFRGSSGAERFEGKIKAFDTHAITDEIADAFIADLKAADPIEPEFACLEDEVWDVAHSRFAYLKGDADRHLSRYRNRLIGRMRNLVAHAAIRALEPDLIILDEFHRFKTLLDDDNEEAELAKALFNQPTARVLLLSATPFSMYTLPDEPEGADHYDDFLATVRFLLGGRNLPTEDVDARVAALGRDLETMRRAALPGADSREEGLGARDRVQHTLTRVMSRVERLASTPDRDGMLTEKPMPVPVTAGDLQAYAGGQRIADAIGRDRGGRDIFELWRSSPYLFNIMETYQVKQALKKAIDSPDPAVRKPVHDAIRTADGLIDWSTVEQYRPLGAGNAKMRALVADTVDRGAWKLAWLPPSLPYYQPAGVFADEALSTFTKRLVFSAWTVAPKAIASVVSYEAERRGVKESGRADRYSERATLTQPIRRPRHDGTNQNMAPEALFQPSIVLAELCDPLTLAQRVGGSPTAAELRAVAEVAVRERFEALCAERGIARSSRSKADPSWYWAAPLLLDRHAHSARPFPVEIPEYFASAEDPDELDVEALGGFPEDLVETVTELGLAGPGTCVLRALRRATGSVRPFSDDELWDTAFDAAKDLRSMFNQAEIAAAVRVSTPGDAYWRSVLDYCQAGNLQSMLDEYFSLGGVERDHDGNDLTPLTEKLGRALSVGLGRAEIDVFDTVGDDVTIDGSNSIRHHFAMRMGHKGATDERQQERAGDVLAAYNSPFWPFVLASTSVGQEGLDFHTYSHAIVHWNLPGNPVDMEQREGRVHRFRGHAIRRNIAAEHGAAVLASGCDDPWSAMFAAAEAAKSPNDTDLVPDWVYARPGGATIERYVPAMPLSRESVRYQRLLRTVGAYRLTLGQPRQEDLVRYLSTGAADGEVLRIDLAPPARG
ncbi:DEAD/DEAH box helicase [Rhodococcus daqingensis]|uniref:DEAD/DEAH box helicase n=1 Tax=Rhodococcus daqingensis TaxID=2479363 RepID=A0ABW2S0S6_9NOCA